MGPRNPANRRIYNRNKPEEIMTLNSSEFLKNFFNKNKFECNLNLPFNLFIYFSRQYLFLSSMPTLCTYISTVVPISSHYVEMISICELKNRKYSSKIYMQIILNENTHKSHIRLTNCDNFICI